MQLTIVRDDNTVIIDGEACQVDCRDLPADFHALQWSGTSGEVEYAAVVCEHCSVRSKKANAAITDLAPYQKYVDAARAVKITRETLARRAVADAARPEG